MLQPGPCTSAASTGTGQPPSLRGLQACHEEIPPRSHRALPLAIYELPLHKLMVEVALTSSGFQPQDRRHKCGHALWQERPHRAGWQLLQPEGCWRSCAPPQRAPEKHSQDPGRKAASPGPGESSPGASAFPSCPTRSVLIHSQAGPSLLAGAQRRHAAQPGCRDTSLRNSGAGHIEVDT